MIGEPAADHIGRSICRAFQLLYLKGLVTPLAGNISARVSDRLILVTPSRKLKFSLEPDDLAIVDVESGEVLKGPRPTSEIRMHLGIYRCCREARAVVHIHGVYAPILAGVIEPRAMDTEAKRIGLKICVLPELEPGSEELAQRVSRAVCEEGCRAIVLANHGIVAVGKSLEEALELAELVELVYRRSLVLEAIRSLGMHRVAEP